MLETSSIRPGAAADLKAMAAIEKSAAINPWSLSQFIESSLRESDASLVLQSASGELLGFALYQCVLDEATLMNIAICPQQQGRGYGSQLLASLIAQLEEQGLVRLLLEVRRSNTTAIRLYHRFGFVDDGLRPEYYPLAGGREDALLMSRELKGRT